MSVMLTIVLPLLAILVLLWVIIKTLVVQLAVNDGNPASEIRCTHHYQMKKPEVVILLVCLMGVWVATASGFDFMLADYIYEHTHWVLKKSFIANGLLHKFSKVCLMILYLFLWVKSVMQFRQQGLSKQVYDQWVMLVAIGLSVAIVTVLKRVFEVDCPWDLTMYGGEKPFFSLFHYDASYLPSAHCFPASHASVGFSWIAVYFYASVIQSRYQNHALLTVLGVGLLFGVTQQLRGAHFISHDLTSLIICLLTAMTVYRLAYRTSMRQVGCLK